jgi:hypothetical protein
MAMNKPKPKPKLTIPSFKDPISPKYVTPKPKGKSKPKSTFEPPAFNKAVPRIAKKAPLVTGKKINPVKRKRSM